MTLETRLRMAFVLTVIAVAAFLYLITMFDPNQAPQWVLSAVFVSAFASVSGLLCFFGYRLRARLSTDEYPETLWRTSLRQALITGLALIVVLGLSAGKIANALNLFFLFAFVISLEMAARRRKHLEITD